MNASTKIKSYIVQVVCLLYVLLFVYAAVSKLLDFENFQVQLGQSPLLSAFAIWLSWLVPVVEVIIALLLLIPNSRRIGLFLSFSLMTMFTTYVFIILHYSSFIPCSCGGVLEKMSWNVHLIFNIGFVALATLAIFIENGYSTKRKTHRYLTSVQIVVINFMVSIASIFVLYLYSEQIMHYENPFVRRYANHPATVQGQKELQFNSYYLAGLANGRIYLGNYTTPLQLLSLDNTMRDQRSEKIDFNPENIPFQMVEISVSDTYFYLKDGRVPAIFRGNVSDWKINKEFKGIPYFSKAVPIDSNTIVFRSNNGRNRTTILGIYTADKDQRIKYYPTLLEKQLDGVFDTDGMLVYNDQTKKIIYLYFYRNEFVVANSFGALKYRGHTIDTTAKAKIKVAFLKDHTVQKMIAPPFIVNANVAVCQTLLFVHSKIKGRYEDDKLWDQASIIDVYDIDKNAYLMSFPIYNVGSAKLDSFLVSPTHLYAIVGTKLLSYQLKPILRKQLKRVDLKND